MADARLTLHSDGPGRFCYDATVDYLLMAGALTIALPVANRAGRALPHGRGDPLQCAEGITGRDCARRSGNQRVHRNPVTLVTLTIQYPGAKLAHDQQRAIGSNGVALQPKARELVQFGGCNDHDQIT